MGREARWTGHRAAIGILVLGVLSLACANTTPVEPLVQGTRVAGASGLYSFEVVQPGWHRMAPASFSEESDLEIADEAETAALVSYVHRGPTVSIDDVVASRLQLVEDGLVLDRFSERRAFLQESDYRPYSIASYMVSDAGARSALFVLTVDAGDAVIEAILQTTRREEEMIKSALNLLSSMRLESGRP